LHSTNDNTLYRIYSWDRMDLLLPLPHHRDAVPGKKTLGHLSVPNSCASFDLYQKNLDNVVATKDAHAIATSTND